VEKLKLQIILTPTNKARQWRLYETIYWGNLMVPAGFITDLMVPAGFITDLASIPVFLRPLFPHGGAKAFAACLHDYLYRNTIGTRKEADGVFLAAMLINGVPKWKARGMYYGVRGFGWLSWAKRKRK